jgi:hypothetical protein
LQNSGLEGGTLLFFLNVWLKKGFLLKKRRVNWLVFSFIGGFHNFIGDNSDLLAKKYFYWRKINFIGDFHYFIGETESAPRIVRLLAANSPPHAIKNTLRRPGGC